MPWQPTVADLKAALEGVPDHTIVGVEIPPPRGDSQPSTLSTLYGRLSFTYSEPLFMIRAVLGTDNE